MRKTKKVIKAKMSTQKSPVKSPVIATADKDIADLRSKTIYNNYAKGMKLMNQKRLKEGRQAIPVRTLEEWLAD